MSMRPAHGQGCVELIGIQPQTLDVLHAAQADVLAVGVKHLLGERLVDRSEGPPESSARTGVIVLRPEHGGQRITPVLLPSDGQVDQQRQGPTALNGHRLAIALKARRPKDEELEIRHGTLPQHHCCPPSFRQHRRPILLEHLLQRFWDGRPPDCWQERHNRSGQSPQEVGGMKALVAILAVLVIAAAPGLSQPSSSLVIVQVNFKYSGSRADYERSVAPLAAPIAQVPGLRWKIWLVNDASREAGGIYLFGDDASAQRFLAGEIAAGLKANPAFSNLSVKKFGRDGA
jgi:hypothetical protein